MTYFPSVPSLVVFLSVYLSLSLFLPHCMSLSVCLSIFLCLSVCLSPSLPSLSLSLSLSLSVKHFCLPNNFQLRFLSDQVFSLTSILCFLGRIYQPLSFSIETNFLHELLGRQLTELFVPDNRKILSHQKLNFFPIFCCLLKQGFSLTPFFQIGLQLELYSYHSNPGNPILGQILISSSMFQKTSLDYFRPMKLWLFPKSNIVQSIHSILDQFISR